MRIFQKPLWGSSFFFFSAFSLLLSFSEASFGMEEEEQQGDRRGHHFQIDDIPPTGDPAETASFKGSTGIEKPVAIVLNAAHLERDRLQALSAVFERGNEEEKESLLPFIISLNKDHPLVSNLALHSLTVLEKHGTFLQKNSLYATILCHLDPTVELRYSFDYYHKCLSFLNFASDAEKVQACRSFLQRIKIINEMGASFPFYFNQSFRADALRFVASHGNKAQKKEICSILEPIFHSFSIEDRILYSSIYGKYGDAQQGKTALVTLTHVLLFQKDLPYELRIQSLNIFLTIRLRRAQEADSYLSKEEKFGIVFDALNDSSLPPRERWRFSALLDSDTEIYVLSSLCRPACAHLLGLEDISSRLDVSIFLLLWGWEPDQKKGGLTDLISVLKEASAFETAQTPYSLCQPNLKQLNERYGNDLLEEKQLLRDIIPFAINLFEAHATELQKRYISTFFLSMPKTPTLDLRAYGRALTLANRYGEPDQKRNLFQRLYPESRGALMIEEDQESFNTALLQLSGAYGTPDQKEAFSLALNPILDPSYEFPRLDEEETTVESFLFRETALTYLASFGTDHQKRRVVNLLVEMINELKDASDDSFELSTEKKTFIRNHIVAQGQKELREKTEKARKT